MELFILQSDTQGLERAWSPCRHHLHIYERQPRGVRRVYRVPQFSILGHTTYMQLIQYIPQAGTIDIDERAWEACQLWLVDIYETLPGAVGVTNAMQYPPLPL